MYIVLSTILRGVKHLFSPRVCRICSCALTPKEEVLCLGCLLGLPRTGIHHDQFNEIHRRLGHHYAIDRAAGWFYYKKGTPYAQLLVDSKYMGLNLIDRRLGEICARELEGDGFFDGIDVLVPMPMHWRKRIMRGYNQAQEICMGISAVTGIPTSSAIRAIRSHGVQARHSLAQRHTSMVGTIEVSRARDLAGRHVLLVDDIITTGASCVEALRAISEASPASISILALGLTMKE